MSNLKETDSTPEHIPVLCREILDFLRNSPAFSKPKSNTSPSPIPHLSSKPLPTPNQTTTNQTRQPQGIAPTVSKDSNLTSNIQHLTSNSLTPNSQLPTKLSPNSQLPTPNQKISQPPIFLDATLGLGGHSREILENFPTCHLIGIDKDIDNLKVAKKNLQSFKDRIHLFQGSYTSMKQFVSQAEFSNLHHLTNNPGDEVALLLPTPNPQLPTNLPTPNSQLETSKSLKGDLAHSRKVHAVLFDLGLSSPHLDSSQRGFSFQRDEDLDMRFDLESELTAAEILNSTSQEKLVKIFQDFGELSRAHLLARLIIEKRRKENLKTTFDLTDILSRVYKHKKGEYAKVFQALRIAVNDELNDLSRALEEAYQILSPGGLMLVISYHSLEDRITKRFFRFKASKCVCPPELPLCQCQKRQEIKILTKKIIRPTISEIELNPRSRSAKMRVAQVVNLTKK